MKIQIITIHNIHNFGSVFQAYALSEYLNTCGYDVEVINYNPPYFRHKSLKTYIGQCLNLKKYMERKKQFDGFVKCNIKLTSENYRNLNELKKKSPVADVYIVGGDQLWNSYHACGNDDAYKLCFVEGYKISYGTSMGRDNYSEKELNMFVEKLKDFQFISVRESSSVDLLKKVGIVARHVVDPVLLLKTEGYKRFIVKPDIEKYLFVYLVIPSETLNQTVRYISEKLGLKVVLYAGLSKKCQCDYFLKNLGPEKILSLIVNADFVLSASFHATLFSIIFHKQFATLLPDVNTNERIEDLLKWTLLGERIIRNNQDLNEKLFDTIIYDGADAEISEKKRISENYLSNALNLYSHRAKKGGTVMKTITVTAQRANNYGAVLQAYALQQIQESIGYENKLLYYCGTSPLFVKCFSKSPVQFIKNIVANGFTLLHLRQMKLFSNRFDEFRNEYLKETKRYDSIEQFRLDIPEADCYISGSDQVWNLNKERNPYRFLEFGTQAIVKYSYAASMSSYSLTEKEKNYIKERLKSFKGISVREESVCSYIEDFTGYNCQCNLDPVFLLNKEKWEVFATAPRIKKPYILCYAVLGNRKLQAIVDQIKKTTKLPVVALQSSAIRHIKADKYIFDAGPREFLGFIKNAEYIVTTSFHGTAFSILFEKKFCTVIKSAMSERMTDLLKHLKLSERVVTDVNLLPLTEIDYSDTRSIIDKEKTSAIEYLKSMKKYNT